MAQGTPVVTSAGTATAEVAGSDGSAGILVDPEDVVAITRALDVITSDPRRRAEMAAAATLRASEFSPASTAAGMAEAFSTAVARPTR
jgi:glycosyltransferase involved in cell wall biosynthesis